MPVKPTRSAYLASILRVPRAQPVKCPACGCSWWKQDHDLSKHPGLKRLRGPRRVS